METPVQHAAAQAPLPLIGIRGDMGHGKDTLAAEICKLYPEEYTVDKFAAKLRRAVEIITDIPAERTASTEDKAAPLPDREYNVGDLWARIEFAIEEVTQEKAKHDAVVRFIAVLTGTPDALSFEVAAILIVGLTGRTGNLPPGTKVSLRFAPMTVGRFLQVLGTECFRACVGTNVWVDALMGPWRRAGRLPTIVADTRFPNESQAIRDAGGVVIHVVRASASRADGRATAHASERALDGEEADVVLANDGSFEDLARAFTAALPRLRELAAARARFD